MRIIVDREKLGNRKDHEWVVSPSHLGALRTFYLIWLVRESIDLHIVFAFVLNENPRELKAILAATLQRILGANLQRSSLSYVTRSVVQFPKIIHSSAIFAEPEQCVPEKDA